MLEHTNRTPIRFRALQGASRPARRRKALRLRAGLSFECPAPRPDNLPSMETIATRISGPVLIEPSVFADDRGFFMESYRRSWHAELGIPVDDEFIQDNHSRSSRGVVRGMHFHVGAGAAKLVRCSRGRILDVVVDLRRGSPTFGEWEDFELDDEQMRILYVPVGFAHGFCVLSDIADVNYKQTAYFDMSIERGIAWDDPDIAVRWPLPSQELIVSARDAQAPLLRDLAAELPFEYRVPTAQ
jgi:dTDP-4-dehydrorhamnose 3,5-epimerase